MVESSGSAVPAPVGERAAGAEHEVSDCVSVNIKGSQPRAERCVVHQNEAGNDQAADTDLRQSGGTNSSGTPNDLLLRTCGATYIALD